MGKKTKNKGPAGSSSGEVPPSKKRKMDSQSPPSRPSIILNYAEMPPNHTKKFFIHDDCGSLRKYIEVISWLRFMRCSGGSSFHGIENLNWVDGQGCPLVEIEIINPSNQSTKILISKNDLYVVAFYAQKWFQNVACGFRIRDGGVWFDRLDEKFNGSYISEPWKCVGPQKMIEAVTFLATYPLNCDMIPFVVMCEVFYVHFCEAARLYPVESLICKTLAPTTAGVLMNRTYKEDENRLLGVEIDVDSDVYSLVKASGPIDIEKSNPTPDYIRELIKKYSNLCKVWYLYSLTERKCCEMRPQDVLRFHMRSVKSLRCTLGVLCNINLNKLLQEWQKKASTHRIVTLAVYEEMEDRVHKLQQQGRVFVQNEDE